MKDVNCELKSHLNKDDSLDLEVLFNSACPVCRAGIEFQKNKISDTSVAWCDINQDPEKLNGLEVERVRKLLHVRDNNGQLHIGIYAFIQIWKKSPKHRFLATLFNLPGITFLAKHAYNGFAELLYRWNRFNNHW